MEHLAYPKIGRSSATSGGGRWVLTEKIHGANFVIGVRGDIVRFGKRKSWLGAGESFFGWQLIRDSLGRTALALAEQLGARSLRVFGELFGGGYPHPEVAPVPGLAPVQTGIWYAPDLRFAAFDAAIEDQTEEERFIAFSELEHAAHEVGLALVPVLARGTRAELERTSPRFVTEVPRALGLPSIANDWAEGWVLKPDVRAPVGQRPCMKRKIPEFDEARFEEARPLESPACFAELRDLAVHLVGPARIASARSKVGIDEGAIIEEVVLDVLVDLHDTFAAFMSRLPLADEQALSRAIEQAARRAL